MELLYKPDWEETKARFRAWWAREYFGRCGLAVFARAKTHPSGHRPSAPATVREQWYDLDHINARLQYSMSRTFYGGEALPVWSAGYAGNTGLWVYLGSDYNIDMATCWAEGEPVLAQDPDFRRLRIDTAHSEYRFAIESLRRGAEWSRGKCLLSIGAFGASGDTLGALRGTEQLLYDCMDRPEWVRAADAYLMDLWCAHYDELYAYVRDVDEGSTCWFGLWAPGKFYAAQNDFSYMISPNAFRDLFLPVIERQTRYLDYTVYHVDGIGAFAHVDALCELPRLRAIQILPGAGKPSPLRYLDVLRKVQAHGRNLHITIPCGEVREALENLSARGLFIQTWCDTEDEARELLRNAERWSVDRG